MAWPGTVASATAGAVGAATDFNNHRDALNAIGDQWTAYTPTLTGATTDPTLGTSSISGRYRKMGKTADVHIHLTIGASGWNPGSGAWRFGLPSGVVPYLSYAGGMLGTGTVRDVSAAVTYAYFAYYFSSNQISMIRASDSTVIAHTAAPITWASGDMVDIHLPSLEIA